MSRDLPAQVAGFLRLAAPMVVSRAGLAGMTIADSVMVARADATQLALLGLAEGTLGRLLDVLVALLLGGIVLAARAQAGEAPREAGAVWRRACALALWGGAAVAMVGLCGQWWLGWLGEAPELAAGARAVVAILGAGVPAALVAVVTAVFLEAVGRPTAVAVCVVAANALNIALNWLLIPGLGAAGSALSTTSVRVALAVALVAYAWTRPDHARLGLRRPAAGFWTRRAAAQRRLGYGAAATAAVMNALGMSLLVFAGWLGAQPLAAVSALWSALSVGALLALGMADATAMRVAATRSQAWGMAGLGLGVTALVLATLAVGVAAAPRAVAGLYSHGPLRDALAALLPLGALVMLMDGAAFVLGAALRGLGDVAWPTTIQVAVAALLVPLAWWLAIGAGGGAMGLVAAILATSVLRALLLAARLRRCAGTTQPAHGIA